MIKFQPDIYKVDTAPVIATTERIQQEPMLYGATVHFVRKHAERYPLTHTVMQRIVTHPMWEQTVFEMAELGYHPVIDTKVVQLMKGQYPCIAGWHCDGVIRKDRESQPDLATLDEPIKHFVCTISDAGPKDHCSTEFITETLELQDVPEGESVWGWVNRSLGDAGELSKFIPDSGEIALFNRSALHRGTAATKRQWRYFFRLSFYHMPAMNEERTQVQVYLDVNGGW